MDSRARIARGSPRLSPVTICVAPSLSGEPEDSEECQAGYRPTTVIEELRSLKEMAELQEHVESGTGSRADPR